MLGSRPTRVRSELSPSQTKKKDWQHSSLGSLIADPLVLCECPPDGCNSGSAAPCELAGGGTIWSNLRFEPRPPGIWPTPCPGPPRPSGGLGTGSTELGLNRPAGIARTQVSTSIAARLARGGHAALRRLASGRLPKPMGAWLRARLFKPFLPGCQPSPGPAVDRFLVAALRLGLSSL